MQETNNKKITWGKVAGIAVAIIVATLIQHFLFNTNNSIDRQLKAASELTNKNCPMYVDSITRLDNTLALPNSTFQYNYSIKTDAVVIDINLLKQNLESNILNSIKTNPSLKAFRDNKVRMVYSYNNEKGNFFIQT